MQPRASLTEHQAQQGQVNQAAEAALQLYVTNTHSDAIMQYLQASCSKVHSITASSANAVCIPSTPQFQLEIWTSRPSRYIAAFMTQCFCLQMLLRLTAVSFAGRICNVSDVPLMCSSINWSAGEVVVGSADHALYVVDVQTGKKRRTLYTKTAGHAEWVTTCQYLPDGRIISGGMDSLLCLWEANSNRCQQLTAHAAPISVVDISPGTNTAVSASYDKSVRVWDVASRRASESSCLTGHAAPVLQLVCGNGDNLISGDRGGTVIMWGLATGSTTSKLKDAHAGHVTALPGSMMPMAAAQTPSSVVGRTVTSRCEECLASCLNHA